MARWFAAVDVVEAVVEGDVGAVIGEEAESGA